MSASDTPIDVTIVCGRRPELLGPTLASFHENLFSRFNLGTVYANIDPFCGTGTDGDLCEAMLRERFERVDITRPETPSFGAAVKSLWQRPQADVFFHMEDDWELLMPLSPEVIFERLKGPVVQVQLASRDRLYLPYTYAFETTWRKTFGLKLFKRANRDRPEFATSPSFVTRAFAAACARQMDPDKDPEKQLYAPDTPLGTYTKSFRNHPLQGPRRKAVVRDLGRPWLGAQGVRKSIVEGVSTWTRAD